MATYTIDKISFGSNKYVLQDSGALQLTGGTVTGPVTFGDSVDVDDLSVGTLSVTGSAVFTNGLSGALTGTVNGYSAAAASAKNVDTSISAASTSANLPTSAAVASFVEGKGYVTTNTTYSISMSGNVITLTGSNGSTSTITLPVYDGGVS